MKLNRKLVLCLAIVLSLVMATSSTLAYLTHTDVQVNTFTTGNVEIDLWEDFGSNSGIEKLLPATGSAQAGTLKNGVNKEVYVTNTGSEDAYVRVHIAIPQILDNGDPSFDASKNVLHFNYDPESIGEGLWDWSKSHDDGKYEGNWNYYETTIDGILYNVYVVTYGAALSRGESTVDAMNQVYMDGRVTSDDVQKIKEALGEEWHIYVAAEGSQAAGFENAYESLNAGFGEPGKYTVDWSAVSGNQFSEPIVHPDKKWVDEIDLSWYKPDATEYEIDSEAKLASLVHLVDQGTTFEGKTIKLTEDLDLKGRAWVPIGHEHAEFKGTFDGLNHTISNMYIAGNASVGLFGALDGALIKNVTLERPVVEGNHWVGTVAGRMISSRVENCHAHNVYITSLPEPVGEDKWDNGDKAGGIVGYAADGHDYIKDCSVSGGEISAYRDLGGIVGMTDGRGPGDEVVNCSVSDLMLFQYNYENYNNYTEEAEFNVGKIVGRYGKTATMAPDCESKDVNIAYFVDY